MERIKSFTKYSKNVDKSWKKDNCIVSYCNNKAIHKTGLIEKNPEHLLKMNELMKEGKNWINVYNYCKMHYLMLMNEDGE